MKKKQSITLNFIFNAILNATKFLFPLITYPYVARVLLPEGTGKVTFATSLVYYFIMFAELGIPTYGIRKCASVREDKEQLSRTVHELLGIQTVTTIISYIVLFLCIAFVPKLRVEKYLYYIVSMGLVLHLVGMEWLYKALEQYRYISIRSILFKIISVVAMFLFVKKESDYVIYGGITIIASSASYACNLFNARKLIYFRPLGNYNLKQHLKPVMVFFAMACAVTIYTNIDTLLLGFMKGDAVVGYYNAAIKVKTIMVSLVTSLSVVLLPRASYYITNGDMDNFRKIARSSILFSVLFATPFAVYFVLFADTSISFLAGSHYAEAILPMQIIMISLVLISLSYPIGMQMLVPLKQEKKVLYSEILGAIVNIAVDLALIPMAGVVGAAIGNVCAEATVLVVQYIAIRKIDNGLFSLVRPVKVIVSVAAGACASIWVWNLGFGDFVELAVSACLFFGVYVLMLVLMKEPMVKQLAGQAIGKILKKTRRK